MKTRKAYCAVCVCASVQWTWPIVCGDPYPRGFSVAVRTCLRAAYFFSHAHCWWKAPMVYFLSPREWVRVGATGSKKLCDADTICVDLRAPASYGLYSCSTRHFLMPVKKIWMLTSNVSCELCTRPCATQKYAYAHARVEIHALMSQHHIVPKGSVVQCAASNINIICGNLPWSKMDAFLLSAYIYVCVYM